MSSPPPQTRRRGAVLEAAILDAAWDQLAAEGYSHFTFETIAARAATSKPVLYRRWSTPEELLRAAIRRHGITRPQLSVPDTGTLRGDLLAHLAEANEMRVDEMLLLSGLVAGHHDHSSALTPVEIRRELLGDRTTTIQRILDRAAARGELDPDRLTPRIADLPFDLFRLEVMTTLRPVPDHVRRQIVDDIFLPLIT